MQSGVYSYGVLSLKFIYSERAIMIWRNLLILSEITLASKKVLRYRHI